jgi:hypothetical protein
MSGLAAALLAAELDRAIHERVIGQSAPDAVSHDVLIAPRNNKSVAAVLYPVVVAV